MTFRGWPLFVTVLLLAASPLLWPAVAPWAVGLLIAGSFVILLRVWWRPREYADVQGEAEDSPKLKRARGSSA